MLGGVLLSCVAFASLAASSVAVLPPITPQGDARTADPISSPFIQGCPKACDVAGQNPSNWTHIHDLHHIHSCPHGLLFDFNIYTELDQFPVVRTCAATQDFPNARYNLKVRPVPWTRINAEDLDEVEQSIAMSATCGAATRQIQLELVAGPAEALTRPQDAAAAARLLASYVRSAAACGAKTILAKSGASVAALYFAPDLQRESVGALVEQLAKQVATGSPLFQICDGNSTGRPAVGFLAVDTVDDLPKTQATLQEWAAGRCVTIPGAQAAETVRVDVLASAEETEKRFMDRSIASRATCRAIQVVAGDSCGSLASRCGISGTMFTKFNPAKNLCSSLMPKQWVCCTAGDLPDMTPKPQPDGTCAVHVVADNDNCAAIAENYGISVDKINSFNKATWGWAGCSRLQVGQKVCLSKGNTPMPSSVDGVVCGPQRPETTAPEGDFDGFDLAKLNPCPLKACCSGWGFCGITAEFCTKAPADTGAPGASKPGKNGCISNCGMKIVNNEEPPKGEFRKLGYFEAFNVNRLCLTMDAAEIPNFKDVPGDEDQEWAYTDVHFAFAGLTEDFDVRFDTGVEEQFHIFMDTIKIWKKVLSFGGWAESTDASTFQLYRDAVLPENRERFANNVAAFANKHNLDGVDFDWEYPGATDIPGVPAGGADQTSNYLEFLKIMKGKLGDRSLSIALPASYWYLRPFPVDKMARVVDYFVFMTYDLHGQWDYGNEFANSGCPKGNCLRSHVNKTETENALAMITKAGVPANKIMVGVSSYARSFGMADPECTGPMFRRWHDDDSDSDIMLYGIGGEITSWAAYMSDETKRSRVKWLESLNFLGSSDWAIDLEEWYDGPEDRGDLATDTFDNLPSLECEGWTWPTTLSDLDADIDSIPAPCRPQAILSVLSNQLDDAIAHYKEASEGYDDKFGYYVDWVKDGINESLQRFMWGNGTHYMDCEWSTIRGSGSGPCDEMRLGLGDLPVSDQGTTTITYTMRNEDGFYKALLGDFGVEKDWVKWVEEDSWEAPCVCPGAPGCSACVTTGAQVYLNWPRRIDDKSKIDVANPKAIVDQAIPNTDDLANVMLDTLSNIAFGTLDADGTDVVTAMSMPVFMLDDAAGQIEQIKEIGAEVEKAKKHELIMIILSVVFAVIPFAGEASLALGGAAAIARSAWIIGEAGNIALSIVEIVDNPESAPFAILQVVGTVAGLRATGARKAFSDAAQARRALGGDKMKLFGQEFQRKDALVQKMVKNCGM